MISLIKNEYCDFCPCFEAETNKSVTKSWNGEIIHIQTDIICKNYEKCAAIRQHIKKQND